MDTKRIDDLVEAYKKELKIKGSTRIQSLEKEIDKLMLKPAERDYFVQQYSGLFPSEPEAPAADAPKPRIVGPLGPWPPGVPRKVKGGKSRRRRNKKGKKKTNKRRRN